MGGGRDFSSPTEVVSDIDKSKLGAVYGYKSLIGLDQRDWEERNDAGIKDNSLTFLAATERECEVKTLVLKCQNNTLHT